MNWNANAPVKVACLGWFAAQEVCPTQNNLQKTYTLLGVIDGICLKRTRRQLIIFSFRVESQDNVGNCPLISVSFHG